MELTLEQALQQAAAAHKEGKLHDAERLYRAILQAQPKHPDANHNLGVLAVAVGKPLEAIPLFKLALEANPQIEQFWLSYLDALIKVNHFDEAARAIADAKQQGVSCKRLDILEEQFQQALTGAVPSLDQQSELLEHYQSGRFDDSETLAISLTERYPGHQFAWKVLGAVLRITGRLSESLGPLQRSVELTPRDPEARNNLGNVLQELGRLNEAEESYRCAISLDRGFPEPLINLGNTLKALERFDEAEASYKKAITLNCRLTEAHYNLGCLLNLLGRWREAEACYRQALQLQPDYADAHNNLGAALKALGRLEEAEVSSRRAIEFNPDHAEAYNNLGTTIKDSGRLQQAEASVQKAIALNPDFAEAHCNLGIILEELGKLEQAEGSFRRAIVLKPELADAHNNLGVTLRRLGRPWDAEASFKKAISIRPAYASALVNLGITFQEQGRLHEAEKSLELALTCEPDSAEAHRALTGIKKFEVKDGQFSQMLDLYLDESTSEQQQCHICFALAKASEDLGDAAAAFQYYAEGNALRKKHLCYDVREDADLFRKLRVTHADIATHQIKPRGVSRVPSPIFIVGMPRSGTTLVEQIISSHSLVAGAGELPFVELFGHAIAINRAHVTRDSIRAFREQYLSELRKRFDSVTFVTDKMPLNFRYLGLIVAAFPESKIVHVRRDPAAVCWANYETYFVRKALAYTYSLDDVVTYYGFYQNLMEHWRQSFPRSVYDLNYERLTINQEEETRKLISHLGLEWDDACLSPEDNTRGVATASNVQVRQKVYQGSSEKWKRYRPYLNGALDHFNPRGP